MTSPMNPKTLRETTREDAPLVTLGQGAYRRQVRPSDLDPDPQYEPLWGEGSSVALVVLILVFVIGFVTGAILW